MTRRFKSLLLAVILISTIGATSILADNDPLPTTTVPVPPNPPELP